MPDTGPSWEEFRLHLVSELSRMTGVIGDLVEKVEDLEKTMVANQAMAQQRARFMGAVWGGVVALAVSLWEYVGHKIFSGGK